MASLKKTKPDHKTMKPVPAEKGQWVNYKFLIIVFSSLFCLMLFKNISYPLIWNDESDTIMTAKQILKYGYPKVNDGKNKIFLTEDTTGIAYKSAWDANIAMPWGHYYFATIGVFLSEHVDDIYLKGGIIRMTFAAMGLMGLILFIWSIRDLFLERRTYFKIVLAFIFFELLSVPLFLHLREARYYSLVLFIIACFFYVFINNFYLKKYSVKRYLFLMTLILFISYQINVIVFASCCITLCICEGINYVADIFMIIKKEGFRFASIWRPVPHKFVSCLPVLISGVLVVPFVIAFETFSTAARAMEFYHYNINYYFDHLKRIFYVFTTQEFLYLVIFVKVIEAVMWFKTGIKQRSESKKSKSGSLEMVSFFMTVFFICYCLLISKMPIPIIWTRYVIVLQPIMILILLIDTVIVFKYISTQVSNNSVQFYRVAFSVLLVIFFSMNVQPKIKYLKEYGYQITHQLKGPLDYLIPFIKEKYTNPENLILATNYEELSYIFYLDCKVILGYVNSNLENDMKYQPDIIIFRKTWGHNPAPYNQLIQRAKYSRVSFPVFDSNVNNIAELDFVIQHQFRTKLPATEQEKSDILFKVQ
jgi:hypothetical protein